MRGARALTRAGSLPLRWTRRLRRRESPSLDYTHLRWYRDATRTYHLTAGSIVPAVLGPLAVVDVEGVANIPLTGR
jgi:hypothetical protein